MIGNSRKTMILMQKLDELLILYIHHCINNCIISLSDTLIVIIYKTYITYELQILVTNYVNGKTVCLFSLNRLKILQSCKIENRKSAILA